MTINADELRQEIAQTEVDTRMLLEMAREQMLDTPMMAPNYDELRSEVMTWRDRVQTVRIAEKVCTALENYQRIDGHQPEIEAQFAALIKVLLGD